MLRIVFGKGAGLSVKIGRSVRKSRGFHADMRIDGAIHECSAHGIRQYRGQHGKYDYWKIQGAVRHDSRN